jgi:hypothetical protein
MGEERDKFRYEAQHLNMDDIGPHENIKDTIGNQPWWFKLQVAGIILGMFIIITGFLGLFLIPFEPYKFYSWQGIPNEVCPAAPISTSTVTEVEPGLYTIGDAKGYAAIVNSNKVPVDTWAIDVDVRPHPKQVMPSGVIRTAPETRGAYKLSNKVTINGRTFGIVPRYQEIEVYSEKSFFVLSESAKQCRGGN